MRRRLIPYGASALAYAVALWLFFLAPIDGDLADALTAAYTAAVFAFKAAMHFWMRRRMVTDDRKLTLFGWSLTDYFVGLTLLAATLSGTLAVALWFVLHGVRPSPEVVRELSRVAVAGAGTLMLGTGAAVAFEMRRAGPVLSVHADDEPWDGSERRAGPKERRKGRPS